MTEDLTRLLARAKYQIQEERRANVTPAPNTPCTPHDRRGKSISVSNTCFPTLQDVPTREVPAHKSTVAPIVHIVRQTVTAYMPLLRIIGFVDNHAAEIASAFHRLVVSLSVSVYGTGEESPTLGLLCFVPTNRLDDAMEKIAMQIEKLIHSVELDECKSAGCTDTFARRVAEGVRAMGATLWNGMRMAAKYIVGHNSACARDAYNLLLVIDSKHKSVP